MKKTIFISAAMALFTVLLACTVEETNYEVTQITEVEPSNKVVPIPEVERSWPAYFLEHKKYFEPKVYKIGDYPIWSINNPEDFIVNTIVIEGETGLIVYDTGIARDTGEAFLKEIRKISDKPIVAIFYSHHHADHYNGTDVMVSPEDVKSGKTRIYAWENFESEKETEFGATGPSQAIRIGYYSGVLLSEEDNHHTGCCGVRLVGRGGAGYIPPTDFLSEDTDLVIDGVEMRAFYTGGEALSEFGLYLPDYKTAIVADEIFPTFPNLYTLRGSKFRDAEGYIRAMDTVLALDVEHLLGTHLVPMSGRDKIVDTITRYRDMIQWIHDQSLRYINKGYTQAELKQQFQEVPDWFENEPFSREMYGTLEHIAPQMHAGYVGYFNGDPIEYKPTPPVEYARRHIALMGGRQALLDEARRAFENDPQWTAELMTYLVRVDHNDMEARHLKAAAFRKLGYAELNTTWRSWFLTSAKELDGELDLEALANTLKFIVTEDPKYVSVDKVFQYHRYRVAAEKARDRHIILAIELSDDDDVTLELRNGILLVHSGIDSKADITMTMDRATLNTFASEDDGFADAINSDKVSLAGDARIYREFWGYFDNDVFADRISVR